MFGATLEQLMLHTQMEQMRRDLIHQNEDENHLSGQEIGVSVLKNGKIS